MILGANRWLHHKSAGVKTHALVALGAALATLVVSNDPSKNSFSITMN
ncbi:MAG: hypothetical protein EBW20_11860 [Betaproteobacteria bacterium]|nr:hypothetical protein [Betaproteobacteria bacterium]